MWNLSLSGQQVLPLVTSTGSGDLDHPIATQ